MLGACCGLVALEDVIKLAFCEDLATFFEIILHFFWRVNAFGGGGCVL
jgi:hypothetical protein